MKVAHGKFFVDDMCEHRGETIDEALKAAVRCSGRGMSPGRLAMSAEALAEGKPVSHQGIHYEVR